MKKKQAALEISFPLETENLYKENFPLQCVSFIT